MKRYRTAIVGTAHLNSHLYALKAVPKIELVAAVAKNEGEKTQLKAGGISTIYSNYESMLDNENLDIVEIDTDPTQRYEMTLAAAERGIHVLGEKPIAVSLKHADEMVSACAQAGVAFAKNGGRDGGGAFGGLVGDGDQVGVVAVLAAARFVDLDAPLLGKERGVDVGDR